MLKLLNKYKKIIIALSFSYIYLVVVLISPSGYGVITPGEISLIDNNIYEIEELNFNNDLNTVSVYSWHEVTNFQKWLIENNYKYEVYAQTPLDKSLSLSDIRKRDRISKDASHQMAIIAAYENAHLINKDITIDYEFVGLRVYTNFGKFIPIDTLIIGIDDVVINASNNVDYEMLFNNLYDDSGYIKQKMQITLASGEKVDVNYSNGEYMYFYPEFKINNTSPKYTEKADNRNVGGPSGGMMQTLAIYTALLNIELDNIKIAGTGTIDLIEYYRIGNIGGLVQKYYTVLENNVDIFFVPNEQFDLLKTHIKSNHKTKVYPVNNLSDIVEIIKELDWYA